MTSTMQQTVVIADYDYGDVDIERAIIENAGLRLVAAQCKTEDDVIEAARDADAIIAQYATVGARAIDAFTRCRVIARYGTGVDIVDVDAATRRGILVTNVPSDWCQNEVADHAMALLLAAARKICIYDRATRAGTWQWQSGEPIHLMQGRTLGLLSFGTIAQAIAARATAFGMRVMAHDPYMAPDDVAAHGASPVSFDELIEHAGGWGEGLGGLAALADWLARAGCHSTGSESALTACQTGIVLAPHAVRGPVRAYVDVVSRRIGHTLAHRRSDVRYGHPRAS